MSNTDNTINKPNALTSADTHLWQLAFPILILALGHTISNMIRTLPAISADLIAQDLLTSPGEIAAMTGFYHLAFAAGQIPVGVALDRYSVKSVSLVLLLIVVIGSIFAAMVQGQAGFIVSQLVLGAGCCGMLLCPLTFAAKTTQPNQFTLWSALILAVGNSGMVISASPIAWVVDQFSWRVAFAIPAIMALAVMCAVMFFVPRLKRPDAKPAPVLSEFRDVLQIGLSPNLRGVVILAFVSFAVMIGIRGMWGGPWLMDAKGLDRIHAGNILLLLTIALIVAPMLVGVLNKRIGRIYELLTVGHIMAGLTLMLLALGAQDGWIANFFGQTALPATYDLTLLVGFGVLISVQPLLFALGRASVSVDHAGKALSAVNLAFFAGAAAIQALSAPVVAMFGLSGVLIFLGLLSIVAALIFWRLRQKQAAA